MKLTSTLLVASWFAFSAVAEEDDGPLQARLRKTLTDLEAIARKHGGNRAAGHPGYKASVDYIQDQIMTRFGDSYDTWTQEFQYESYNTTLETLKGPDGEDVDVKSPTWSANTTGTTGFLFDTPVSANGSMCTLADWDGLDPTGKIALIRRGECAVSAKARFAKEKGAIAVIVYNQPSNETLSMRPSFEKETDRGLIPVGLITLALGEAWKQRLIAGEDLKVTLATENTVDWTTTWNLLAQSRSGDPRSLILSGAHLDSVPEGPGMEDNASGSAALLEMISLLSNHTEHKNALRFAWWGAEELGLLGSEHYVKAMNQTELDNLKFCFNYDMVGAIGPDVEFGIMPQDISNNGPAKRMAATLEASGVKTNFFNGNGRTDYAAFAEAGVPWVSMDASGNMTGECYHEACDDITVIGFDTLALSVKAGAYALEGVLDSLEGVPARASTLQSRAVRPAKSNRQARWNSNSHHRRSQARNRFTLVH